MKEQQRGIIAGFSAYLLWGLLTLYWRELHAFDAFELIGWRVMSATVMMSIVLTATRQWSMVRIVARQPRLVLRVAAAAALLTTNWTTYVYTVVHGRVLEAALGYFIAPLTTMAVGVVVLGERLRRAQLVSIAFAVAAVVVLTVSYERVPLLALLLAATWTGYGYLKKEVPLTPIESMAAESFLLVVPAGIVLALRWSSPTSIPHAASGGELALVAISGIATVIPLMLFAFSAKRVPLTIIAPLQYIVPLINFILGWLVLHEDLPASRVIGFSLIWIALMVLTIDSTRRARTRRAMGDQLNVAHADGAAAAAPTSR